jgi:hypothetical protein
MEFGTGQFEVCWLDCVACVAVYVGFRKQIADFQSLFPQLWYYL